MALLEATEISKRFGGIVALNDLSLSVEARESVGLVGPNGAGKTTLFNCLLGLLRPDTGSVTFEPGWGSAARSSAWSCSTR